MSNWKSIFNQGNERLKIIIDTVSNFALKNNYALMGEGSMGVALLLYYYSMYSDIDQYRELADNIIVRNLNLIKAGNTGTYSLCNGMAGFLWAVNHLKEQGFIDVDSEELFYKEEADLFNIMKSDIQQGKYDLLHNSLGIALCFLNRDSSLARSYVECFINGLDQVAEKDSNGIKWRSMFQVDETERHVFNLSLSHGISSIVIFLAKAYKQNIAKETTYNLLSGALKFIFSHEIKDDTVKEYSQFPSVVFANESGGLPCDRLAWCYGDLGIGMASLMAAKITGNHEWEDKALIILLNTISKRNSLGKAVIDAGICHGSSGIAHIYNRVYQYSGVDSFRDEAVFWLNDTIQKAKFEDGIAGYKAWRTEKYGGWVGQIGLLEGISGIGLVLISSISNINPFWDECLLLT